MNSIHIKESLRLLIRAKLLANTPEEAAKLFEYPALLSHNGLTQLPYSTITKWNEKAQSVMTSDGLNYFLASDIRPFCTAYSLASQHYDRLRSDKWHNKSINTVKFLKSKEGLEQILKYSYTDDTTSEDYISGIHDDQVAAELKYQKARGVKQFYTICLLLMFAGYLYSSSSKVKSDPHFTETFETGRERLLSFVRATPATSQTAIMGKRLFYNDTTKTRFKLVILFSFVLDSLSTEIHPGLRDVRANPAMYTIMPPIPEISYWKETGVALDKTHYYVIKKEQDSYRITHWSDGHIVTTLFMTCYHDGSCVIVKEGFNVIREIREGHIQYNDNAFVQSIEFEGHFGDCKRIIFTPIDNCDKIDIDSLEKIPEEKFPYINIVKILGRQQQPAILFNNTLPLKGELLFISKQGLLFSGPEGTHYLLNTDGYPELENIGLNQFNDCGLVEYMGKLHYFFKHMQLLIPVNEKQEKRPI